MYQSCINGTSSKANSHETGPSCHSCSCGLTRQHLTDFKLVGAGGVCTAFKQGSNKSEVCGELFVDHPPGVPAGPPAGKPIFGSSIGTAFQGLPNPTEALPRDKLLNSIISNVAHNRFVMLQSPPASGKSSLLQMLWKRLPEVNVKYVSMFKDVPPHNILTEIGIDCMNNIYDEELLTGEVLVLVDDAQNCFATYLIGGESPCEFSLCPRIGPEDMLLTYEESFDFFVNYLSFPYHNMTSLVDLILRDCGGNIGALSITASQIVSQSTQQMITEQTLKDFFISHALTFQMSRLFGSETFIAPTEDRMVELLCKGEISISEADFVKDNELKRYIKSGFLIGHKQKISLASKMSRRYFMWKLYPQSAIENPRSLLELVLLAIRSLSTSALARSAAKGFPKEAVFQHLMMQTISSKLTPDTCVYPENSVIVGTNQTIVGEIDFFIDHNLRWGIELLLKGIRLKEHRERFVGSGKYVDLGCSEYLVVDFKSSASGVPKVKANENISNKVSVYFKDGEYNQVTCLLPDGTKEVIMLAP